jgi:signal transduction histidine kinase
MGTTAVRWPTSGDVALAAAFGVVAEVELRLYDLPILAGTVPRAVDSLLVLLPLVPVAWRRAAPLGAALAMALAVTAVGVSGGTICFFSCLVPFLVLIYTASAWSRSPYDVVALAVPLALLLPMLAYDADFRLQDFVFAEVFTTAAWIAGQAARRWRRQSERLAAALAEAERGRAATEQVAVARERARIARELHDVVAHGMSVIVMQAGAARPAVRDDPDQVATALERIEEVGRNAMLEMRRLLGILREDPDDARHPQPRLEALPALVDELTAAGLTVEQRVDGRPRPLPDAQDVSAYRIVQEALTNALRHGSGGCAAVTLGWQDDRLRIEVSNPVRPDRAADGVDGTHGGHGLVGIRERVALFDGRLSVASAGGRFVTVAELPYDGEPA